MAGKALDAAPRLVTGSVGSWATFGVAQKPSRKDEDRYVCLSDGLAFCDLLVAVADGHNGRRAADEVRTPRSCCAACCSAHAADARPGGGFTQGCEKPEQARCGGAGPPGQGGGRGGAAARGRRDAGLARAGAREVSRI